MKLALALLAVFVFAVVAPARDIYVATTGSDGNSGGIADPYATISYAVNMSVSGDTIRVRAGTYIARWITIKSGTELVSEDGVHAAKLYSQDISCIRLTNDNCGIDGFEIYADYQAGSPGDGLVRPYASNNTWIKNCRIHDAQNDADVIKIGANNVLIENCIIYNASPRASAGTPYQECVDIYGATPVDGVTLRGCWIFHTPERGGDYLVYAKGASRNIVWENNVFGPAETLPNGNCSTSCGGPSPTSFPSCENFIARNNLFVHCGGDGAFGFLSAKNAHVYNNVFYDYTGARSVIVFYTVGEIRPNEDCYVFNNIFLQSNGMPVYEDRGKYIGSTYIPTNFQHDYNLYHLANSGGDIDISLEANSVFADPQLTGPTMPDRVGDTWATVVEDFLLTTGSAAIDAATDLSGGGMYNVDTDVYGTARPIGTAFDIGIHEYDDTVPIAPIITEVAPDPDTATAGLEYSIQLTLDQSSSVTWTLLDGPDDAVISSAGRVSGWTPDGSDIGTTVTFEAQATNVAGSDTETWQVSVVAPPAPVIDEVVPDPDTATATIAYSRQLTLSAGDQVPVQWAIVQAPAGANVDGAGLVSGWAPAEGDAGTMVTFEISAANLGGSDTETWQVYVEPTPPAFIETGGMVCMEAEHYGQISPGAPGVTNSWQLQTGNGSSNDKYMAALPFDENRIDVNIEATSPRLRYMVSVSNPDQYYLWILGYGPDGMQDSVHYGLDNVSLSYDYLSSPRLFVGTTFGWTGTNGNGTPVTLSIPSPGLYALDIWMRESGARIDKLLLVSNPQYTPSAIGPPESELTATPPALLSSTPPVDGTLAKTQNNVITLTFDSVLPWPGDVALDVAPIGGGSNVGDSFPCSVEGGDTLKAIEDGAVLTDQTWYRVTPAAGFSVSPFVVDLCVLQGDANGTGRVTTADYSEVKAHMGEYTDAPYDLNGSGRITTADYSIVKANMASRAPAKP